MISDFRVGFGYDSHRLTEGRPLKLGGVEIPHTHGLDGHSDADAVLHAIIDAILGAAALGDIGQHFPDTDERFRDASSDALLIEAVLFVRAKGYEPVNVDVTVIAEAPRLRPHVDAMRARIAEILGTNPGAVSVKGKTSEHMGAVGRGEGIEVHAVALVKRG